MIIANIALSMILGIDQFERKCIYVQAEENQTVTFKCKVIQNLNIRKAKLSKREQYYMPDMRVLIIDENKADLTDFNINYDEPYKYVSQKKQELKYCIQQTNDRQKVYMFGFDVELFAGDDPNNYQQQTQMFKKLKLKSFTLEQEMRQVNNKVHIETIEKLDKTARKTQNAYAFLSVFFIAFFILITYSQQKKLLTYIKNQKL